MYRQAYYISGYWAGSYIIGSRQLYKTMDDCLLWYIYPRASLDHALPPVPPQLYL